MLSASAFFVGKRQRTPSGDGHEEDAVGRSAEDRRNRENDWPVVAMAPLHRDKDHNSGERALFLTVAELK